MSDTHTHDENKSPHPHPKQPDTEDGPLTDYVVMTEAVGELLIEKGVFSADDLRAMIETIDTKTPADGGRVIARAWLDPEFKVRFMEDVNAAAEKLGIDAGTIPIRAVENTHEVHNVIVCTLCSCYPKMLLGLPPDWYKARAYRSRVVSDPRGVLREFGTEIASDVEIRVHDSTADLRYMVLPMRPDGTEGMGEGELAEIVNRDSMIGVTTVRKP